MKRIISLLLIVGLLTGLISCNSDKNLSHETTPTIENTNSISSSEKNQLDIHNGFEISISEIELPSDGERIEYSPAFLLFSGDDGYQIKVNSSERQGERITFYTDETGYYFDPLGMTMITSNGQVFISLNGVRTDNNTYKYEIYQYHSKSPDDPVNNTQAEIKAFLGNSYRAEKNYYYVTYCTVISTKSE